MAVVSSFPTTSVAAARLWWGRVLTLSALTVREINGPAGVVSALVAELSLKLFRTCVESSVVVADGDSAASASSSVLMVRFLPFLVDAPVVSATLLMLVLLPSPLIVRDLSWANFDTMSVNCVILCGYRWLVWRMVERVKRKEEKEKGKRGQNVKQICPF